MAERGFRQVVVVDERPARGRRQRARPLRAAAGVDAPGDRGAARRASRRRRCSAPREDIRAPHREPDRAGRRRRAADAHDRGAQRRADRAGCSTCAAAAPRPRRTSTGAGWRSAARGAASRRSRPTRTTRSSSTPPTRDDAAKPSASGCWPSPREVNDALATLGFPLCTGNVMASNPRAVPVAWTSGRRSFLGWIARSPRPRRC